MTRPAHRSLDENAAPNDGADPCPGAEPEWPCDPVESVFARTRDGQLTEDQWRHAIERIVATTEPELEARFAGRRDGGERYFRQASCMLRVVDADGAVGVHLVTTRNLSRGGLSVIHGQELAIGSTCVLALEQPEGPGAVREASIEWCRAVEVGQGGAAPAFELGLRFKGELDVTPFLENR